MLGIKKYYVTAHAMCGFVPLGTYYTNKKAEKVKRKYEEKQKNNPLFEKVNITVHK